MRSALRSPGVPSTREAGTASLVGGPSNRPMRAGFAENNFLIIVLCRLAPREERRERLLRIIRPHALREYFVLTFHCLLQLFAQRTLHQALGSLYRSGGLCRQSA